MGSQHNLHHSLIDILTTSNTLNTLVNKASALNKLNQALLEKLDPALSPHCRVTNLRDGILILTTPSPAWGYKLRFAEMELLSTLRKEPEWCGLKSIQSRVRPLLQQDPYLKQQFPAPVLSKQSACHLLNTANGIECPKLRQSLLKLSSRGSRGI